MKTICYFKRNKEECLTTAFLHSYEHLFIFCALLFISVYSRL